VHGGRVGDSERYLTARACLALESDVTVTGTLGMRQTWDGNPIAPEPPYGASIIVYRVMAHGTEYLVLHRAQRGPDYEGDWAWTPPGGARYPGEAVEACAERELLQEAGLGALCRRIDDAASDWAIFLAEARDTSEVVLNDAEHDRFEWVTSAEALTRCRPGHAARGFELARRMVE